MKPSYLLIVVILLLTGCNTKKLVNTIESRPPYIGDIKIKGIGENIPDNAVLLGSVFVGESGFTSTRNCTYQKVLHDVVTLAKDMGGDIIVITKHIEPNTSLGHYSSCHQISANVYSTK